MKYLIDVGASASGAMVSINGVPEQLSFRSAILQYTCIVMAQWRMHQSFNGGQIALIKIIVNYRGPSKAFSMTAGDLNSILAC